MAETTGIGWTDSTVSFWWGCTKVSSACDHCYAETLDKRVGGDHWGMGKPRKWINSAIPTIRKLERRHRKFFKATGRRRRVFVQSMSDIFDNEVPERWRADAYAECELATNLDIQFVTKRGPVVEKLVPRHWLSEWPRHIGLIFSVCDQAEYDRDAPRLRRLQEAFDVPWVGFSVEPLLEPITGSWFGQWTIAGGESGSGFRDISENAFEAIRQQCAATGTPFFFKQRSAFRSGQPAIGPHAAALNACKQFPDMEVKP
jgi:protein gp37